MYNHPVQVINATGVIIHTGLGRAPWLEIAEDAVSAASRYTILEIDRESGTRGERTANTEQLLAQVCDAESGVAVNNNAAAVVLTLAALAAEQTVVVAQGHLVEIGGSFRLPQVFAQSGCRLKAVGAVNVVTLDDYSRAINADVAALFIAHHSNFWIDGEHSQPDIEEIVSLCNQRGIPLIYDLGSGMMYDLARYGISSALTVPSLMERGVDVVCFSGDKLFGGPQAGLITGKRDIIYRIRTHPLYRAMRLDKSILAALNATLSIYNRGEEEALGRIPVLRMLTEPPKAVEERAESVWHSLSDMAREQSQVRGMISRPGGGTMPQMEVESWGLVIKPQRLTLRELAHKLRMGEPAVFGRLSGDEYLLDMRTVGADEVDALVSAIEQAMQA